MTFIFKMYHGVVFIMIALGIILKNSLYLFTVCTDKSCPFLLYLLWKENRLAKWQFKKLQLEDLSNQTPLEMCSKLPSRKGLTSQKMQGKGF